MLEAINKFPYYMTLIFRAKALAALRYATSRQLVIPSRGNWWIWVWRDSPPTSSLWGAFVIWKRLISMFAYLRREENMWSTSKIQKQAQNLSFQFCSEKMSTCSWGMPSFISTAKVCRFWQACRFWHVVAIVVVMGWEMQERTCKIASEKQTSASRYWRSCVQTLGEGLTTLHI